MAGITLAQAEAQLTAYLDAEEKVLNNQAYSIKDRNLQRASLESIQAGIERWDKKVQRLTRGGIVPRGVTPITD